MFRTLASPLALLVVLGGCGDDDRPPPPPPPADSGRDTATMMDADLDAGMDAPAMDGSTDAPVDAATDADVPTVPVVCEPGTPPASCESDADCDATERCVEGGCPIGSGYCTPAGRFCSSPDGCPTGSTCTDGPSGRVCVSDDPDTCTSSATCPFGFACEGGSCVDRRLPCDPPGGCPLGYVCIRPAGSAVNFCVDMKRPCGSDGDCFSDPTTGIIFRCLDVLGDGNRWCLPSGECTSNVDCEPIENTTCGASPATGEARCNLTGLCVDEDDCVHDRATCEDTHGTGVTECLPIGSCTRDSDCPPGALCFDGPGPIDGGVPTEGDGMAECVRRRPDL